MSECPKCGESGLTWIKTSSGKHWLKRDLGEGQISSQWHTCNTKTSIGCDDKPLHSFCHECKTKVQNCMIDDCELCNGFVADPCYCFECNAHVSVVDKR